MASLESKKDIHTWKPISLGGKNGRLPGTFKMNVNGLAWRSNAGQTIITVVSSDLRSAEWIRLSKIFQIRIRVKGGVTHKFDGFKEQDGDFLKSFFRDHFPVELQDLATSTKGWNWGENVIVDNHFVFKVGNEAAFEIPLSEVLQATVASKKANEVLLKFHQDDTMSETTESIVEMRFHFGTEESSLNQNKASKFTEEVLQGADTTSAAGKGIVSFDQVPILVPRGRYQVEMFSTFLELHGKSLDYKIKYSSIVRLFQLPRPDRQNVMFVLSLEPPIRQGQTSYPHVVMQFEEGTEITPTVNIPKELENDPRLKQLVTISEGLQHKIIAQVFKILTDKKITVPKSYKGGSGGRGIKCSLKANEGYLFPLEKSFFFVHKPTTHIRFEEVDTIDFCRVSDQNFDINMNLKSQQNLQFKYMPREDYSNFVHFLTEKGITCTGETSLATPFQSTHRVESGSQEEDGPRRSRSSRQGISAVRQKVKAALDTVPADSDESEDDDFGDKLSSDEEVASNEIDSEPSSEESDNESKKKKDKKPKEKKEKKPPKAKKEAPKEEKMEIEITQEAQSES